MSVAATNWAFSVAGSHDLSRSEALSLLALAHRHNAKTGRCDPSFQTLSKMVNLSKRSVISAIQSLEDKGLICTIQRKTKQGQITNQYRLGSEATSQGGGEVGDTPGGEAASPNRDIYTKGRKASEKLARADFSGFAENVVVLAAAGGA